jgi:hypothetical protein
MRIWLLSVGVLFLGVQVYHWLAAVGLPLWLAIVLGSGLAIASNRSTAVSSVPLPPPTPEDVAAPAAEPSQAISFKISPPTH